jgi:hypothetical protein
MAMGVSVAMNGEKDPAGITLLLAALLVVFLLIWWKEH